MSMTGIKISWIEDISAQDRPGNYLVKIMTGSFVEEYEVYHSIGEALVIAEEHGKYLEELNRINNRDN